MRSRAVATLGLALALTSGARADEPISAAQNSSARDGEVRADTPIAVTDADAARDAADRAPRLVTWFAIRETPREKKCPKGRVDVPYARGRFILGTSDGKRAGRVWGKPIRPSTDFAHYHFITITTKLKTQSERLAWCGGLCGLYASHEVARENATGVVDVRATTTTVADVGLPVISLTVCAQDPADEASRVAVHEAMPFNAVAFFTGAQCPAGWEPFAGLDGRLPVALQSDGTPNAQVAAPWRAGPPPLHNFKPDESTFGVSDRATGWTRVAGTTDQPYPLPSGTASVVTTALRTHPGLNTFTPYVELLACAKKDNDVRNDVRLPPHMTILSSTKLCPERWETTQSSAGRFLLGEPLQSEPTNTFNAPLAAQENRVHKHSVQYNFSIPERWVFVTAGDTKVAVPQMRSLQLSLESTLDVPYIQLRHCSTAAR